MKTKLQILTAFVGLMAFSNATMAWEPTFNKSEKSTKLNVVTPTDNKNNGSILTNATVMSDGTVISNPTANDENIDNTNSILSYHHGSGGGDGDGNKGKSIITLSVGFVSISGLLTSSYTGLGYSVSSIPPITLAYQYGLSEKLCFGAQIAYTSFSLSETGQIDNTFGYYPNNVGQVYSYTNKQRITGIGFGLVGSYSFVTGSKIDPYFGYGVGYEVFSANWTTTDPNTASDGNIDPGGISGGLPWFNIFLGSRFFFTNNVGAFVEFGWHGLVGGIIEVGLAAKF